LAEVHSEEEEELTANDIACWDEVQRSATWQGAAVGNPTAASPVSAAGKSACVYTKGHTQAGGSAPAPAQEPAGRKSDYDTVFTNAKAGMEGVDKDYVKDVVFKMSRDSNFFKNEQRKNEENSKRNRSLKQQLDALGPSELAAAGKWADKHLALLEKQRDLSRTFIHVGQSTFSQIESWILN